MSVLGAFYTTWDNARQTYGQGTPETGEKFDNSSKLRQLESGLEAAAPGSRWSGSAATNYDAANTEHRRVIGELATLDQKLKTQVDQSAEVVSAGRRDLENLRKWVADMEASIPPGKSGEQMRMALAQKGLAQLQEIVQRSNGESNAIAAEIRKLQGEFEALGSGQKFAKEGKEGDAQNAVGEEQTDEKDPRKRAEQDVQDALAGDQQAAARVEEVIGSIKPGQELSPEQASYLSQMQAQQNGMTVEQLKSAEQRLGGHKDIIGDSWQLMSNPNVQFPKAETKVGSLDDPNQIVKGSVDQLPQSVQQAIKSDGVLYAEQMRDIAGIVRDGDPALQTGTELDREMLSKADRMMDAPIWEKDPASNGENVGRDPFLDPVVSEIFTSAGRDHQVVHDHLLGKDGDDFLHDINQHAWADKGVAAGSLIGWTENAQGGA
ncbi:EspA/EspE family type VII secretion system effector [Mycobacterium hubeiense]|uniref:TPR repeat region-containing protein n=1 Tax=Mycobacterium hubeiense TaxID=1867256 RepID=UPI000C7EF5C2|nr:EspA/EspE family type VII secretion system effector [Mycobacterium sp. QGD 101]